MDLKPLEIVTLTFYAIISIVTILANGSVIIVFIFAKKFRTTSNYFIISLSFADLCIGLVIIPMRATEILRPSFTNSIDYCRTAHSFTLLNFTASVSNLMIITVDRYIAILHPYLYYQINKRPARYIASLIISAWSIVILVTFLPLYGWGSNGRTGPRIGSLGICRFSETINQDFILFILISVLSTSFLLIIPMYVHIFIVARKHIQKIHPLRNHAQKGAGVGEGTGGSSSVSSEQQRRKVDEKRSRQKRIRMAFKTTKTMFLVVLIFMMSWLAFVVSTLMFIICKTCANGAVVLIATMLMYFGSCLNPFVYFIRLNIFQQEMSKLLKKIQC